MQIYEYSADSVVNYDKTHVFIADEGRIAVKKVGKDRAQLRGTKGRTIGSLISFVGASGKLWLSVWIFAASAKKNKKLTPSNEETSLLNVDFTISELQKYPKRSNWPSKFAWTKSGYSNAVLHGNIIFFCYEWLKVHRSC